MKKLILIISFFMLSLGFKTIAQTQTEEYAIVDVFEYKKQKVIRITVGNEPVTEKEWEVEKNNAFDFSPVTKVLHELNKKGFKLLNMSTTFITVSGVNNILGTPRFTFIMVRKIE